MCGLFMARVGPVLARYRGAFCGGARLYGPVVHAGGGRQPCLNVAQHNVHAVNQISRNTSSAVDVTRGWCATERLTQHGDTA